MSRCPYLGNTPDVLLSVLGGETKVLVQTETNVVAVQSVGLETKVEEVLLERDGDGGLARGGETSEPDGGTLLLAEVAALSASETRVPGDVAIAFVRILLILLSSRLSGVADRGALGRAKDKFSRWRSEGLTWPLLLVDVEGVWRIKVRSCFLCWSVSVTGNTTLAEIIFASLRDDYATLKMHCSGVGGPWHGASLAEFGTGADL